VSGTWPGDEVWLILAHRTACGAANYGSGIVVANDVSEVRACINRLSIPDVSRLAGTVGSRRMEELPNGHECAQTL
jgi:hypothetical protein